MSGWAPLSKIQMKTKRHQPVKVVPTKVLDQKLIVANLLIVDLSYSVCDSEIHFTVSIYVICNIIFYPFEL